METKLVFVWKVLHVDSLWSRGTRELGNSLLLCLLSAFISSWFLGVPRKTAEELDFANFSIFEDPEDYYSTFNFHYPYKPFDRLAKLCEFNTLLAAQTIKKVMADCVRKRREGKAMAWMDTSEANKA